MFVLDASVAISWCFPGDPAEDTAYSRRILALLETHDALVPGVWPFEIANSIFVSHNVRKRISDFQIEEYLDLLRALPIRVVHQELWFTIGIERLARQWNLAAYDAAYLDLALREGVPLATTDSVLKRTATAEGVPVIDL